MQGKLTRAPQQSSFSPRLLRVNEEKEKKEGSRKNRKAKKEKKKIGKKGKEIGKKPLFRVTRFLLTFLYFGLSLKRNNLTFGK